jgi:choline dehydrogenase-like flavoprotein
MFSRLDSIDMDTELSADLCIVGAGPAGITLARELASTNRRIIVIESGYIEFDFDTQDLYAGTRDPYLPPVPLDVTRLRYFGGSSNHWGGTCAPFWSADFRKRFWIANSGWPITRADLDRYYEAAHNVIGLGPFNYDPEFWKDDSTYLFNLSGTDLLNGVMQNHAQRFGPVYQKELEKSRNVRVILGANLTDIEVSANASAVLALEVRSLTGRRARVVAKDIVLACGGVENARLLLSSGIAPELPAAGRYYSFHPRLRTGQVLLERPLKAPPYPYFGHKVRGTDLTYHVVMRDDVQQRERLPNHRAIITENWVREPRGYKAVRRLYARLQGAESQQRLFDDLADLLSDLDSAVSGVWSHWRGRDPSRAISLLTVDSVLETVPNPESRVMLDEKVDPFGKPRARVHWAHHDFERSGVRRFNEIIGMALGAAGIGRLRIAENLEDESTFYELMREGTGGGGHYVGTTRMSDNRQAGVVDSNCKVHGVANLYCAGSSVFPTGSSINPTLTIVALALRLAEHLKTKQAHQ